MIDREELRRRYRAVAIRCALMAMVPVIALGFTLWVRATSFAGSGATPADPMMLVILGSGLVIPFGVVYWLRRSMRNRLAMPATSAEATVAHTMSFASLALMECDGWMAASVFGMLIVLEGGPIAFAYVGFVISVAGFFYSFPRWSAVVARAELLEAPRGAEAVVPS